MHRWAAKRQTIGRHMSGGTVVIPAGTRASSELDSPMQEIIRFRIDATGHELWLETDQFIRDFRRIPAAP
jgi:hypothetical protein